MQRNVEISFNTILKTVLLALAIIFVILVKELVVMLIISFIISSAYSPLVQKLKEKKVPKVLSALFLYASTLFLISLLLYLVIQPLSQEFSQISKTLPKVINQLASSSIFKDYSTEVKDILLQFSDKLQAISFSVINLLIVILGGFLQTGVILVLSFYLTIQEDEIPNFISKLLPSKYQGFLFKIWLRSQKKLGAWLKAQFFLMFIIGLFSFIGLYLLGIPFALSIGILAGFFEIIPYVGPVLSAVVGVFISLIYAGPFYALLALILFFLIQQMENYLIVPKVMQKAVQLSPILVMSALYIGGKLGGGIGGLIAIPVTLLIVEAIKEYQTLKHDYDGDADS